MEQNPQNQQTPGAGGGPYVYRASGSAPASAPVPVPGYGGFPAAAPPPPPQKPRGARRSPLQLAILAVSVALLLLVGMVLVALVFVGGQIGGLTRVTTYNNNPPSNSFAVIQVVGTIQKGSASALGANDPSYLHADTVAYVKSLAENDNNKGILLYLNTPGGGVYESDELYLALQAYREATGRPIWGYMADTCASGGYYVAAAADQLYANRNTITGSIGVYIALTDTSGLYDMLGIETVLVRSGQNKGVGTMGVPITNEQRAVYQTIVDEDYAEFVGIVAEGRGMDIAKVRQLSDGRVYSGRQALQNGLVDELGDWDTTLAAFEEATGARPSYPNFSRSSTLGAIIGSFSAQLPQNETQTQLSMAEKYPVGVPMALYDP